MKCATCGRDFWMTPLFRVNPLGERGIFKCRACLSATDPQPDPETDDLVVVVTEMTFSGEVTYTDRSRQQPYSIQQQPPPTAGETRCA